MPLMTQDEYNEIDHKIPHFYKIQNKNQFLYFFGERHSFDPKNNQWIMVKKFWSDFINDTNDQKKVAFVESGRPSIEENEEKSISGAGGTGLITFLASKQNIEVYCPEPNAINEIHELEKKFTKEEIEYYYFARIVHQWGRIPEPRPNFEEYVTRFLEKDKRISGWSDFDFSLENMKTIHKKNFGTEFSLSNLNFFKEIVTPVELNSIINKVSRASGDFREEYIVGEINKYWNNGYSIYVEYGASHAIMQEPLLREILNKK